MFYDWYTFSRSIIAGFLTFNIIHFIFSRILSSKDAQQYRKYINISTSFIHSTISSIISIYLFIENPSMCTTDVISSFTLKAYSFISFEMGYFIYDSIDMLRHSSGRQTNEILLHHITIITCFGISVYFGLYIGYCVISLYIEINSIFLHLRQLLLFSNISKQQRIYRINNLVNLSTFLVFRFGILTYMSIWLFVNRSSVPLILCIIGQSGLLIMTILNCLLISRLYKSDFSSLNKDKL